MKLQKFISSLLLISFLTGTARGQQIENLPEVETPQGEVDPGEAISPMKLNQRAPFTGVMLSPKALASLIAQLKSIDARVKLAGDQATENANEVCRHEKQLDKIGFDADKEILNARIESNEKNLRLYEKQLTEVQDSQPNSALLIGLGAVGGAAVTVLAVFAVAQSMK